MKILHTADWHIGKRLHNYSLSDDFERFSTWLQSYILAEKIDVLLLAGDVFDTGYPSLSSQQQYFNCIATLKKKAPHLHIIITDGNHDSTTALNAPKELLKYFDVQIRSGLTSSPEDEIVEIKEDDGTINCVICAVPFLRDRDIRKLVDQSDYDDRINAVKEGIKQHYQELAELVKTRVYKAPVIAMGHLYTHGVSSDQSSEREIQMGHQAGVEGNIFSKEFDYVALGHIHSAQQIKGQVPIFYSGSPFPLSFSERNYEHGVRQLEFTDGELTSKKIAIPKFRRLIKIKGTLDDVRTKLFSIDTEEGMLNNLIELEIIEEKYNPTLHIDIEELMNEHEKNFSTHQSIIIKHRFSFNKEIKSASEMYDESVDINDLTPYDVFKQRLDQEDKIQIEEGLKQQLLDAFLTINEQD
ncbi:exonuclease subunit SbcD [Flammeovirga agarivorans]|uniref:Nuclease SbcCD subunit D n=1 Tax=Flammeovirga agarivorans TaxID=2726742 RepID=A0A7X8SIT8_9BACT|nr:exonuclease subunit SbcD [Flammeovirga agarivorans]NLR90878.1 exonuclease subunit SbcD [Flammeovirga agarivorans]